MPEVEAMKYVLFLLAIFSIQSAIGAQAFRGSLSKKGEDYYFTPQNTGIIYQVDPLTLDVIDNLKRLENGDFIMGNGTLNTLNNRISIESVDYVGLRRLLGPWVGTDGTIVFKNFSTMHFTPRIRENNSDIKFDANLTKYQKEFRYSMSPSDGNEWALFMSDDKITSFATLEFSQKNVIMKIFESESGKVVRTLKLERP